MALLEISSAVSAATAIAEKLPPGLSRTAVRLYTALVGAAIETMRRKGYSANTTHMVIHAPVEQVARAIQVSRQSVWRHSPALKALGIVDHRTHKGTCRGLSRNTGTVFMVRLNPASGSKCRLSYDDPKHKWRDLDKDIRAGRSSYRALKHTSTLETGLVDILKILDWSLNSTNQAPVKNDVVCNSGQRASLESLLDVKFSRGKEKARAVDTAATALSQVLSDSSSLNFYRRIVWGAYRRSQAGTDYFQVIYNMVTRAAVDRTEGFAKRPGALLISRLRQAGLYDELLQT